MDLNIELNLVLNKYDIEYIYHNFTMILSTSISKVFIKVTCKRRNIMTSTWRMWKKYNCVGKSIGMPLMGPYNSIRYVGTKPN